TVNEPGEPPRADWRAQDNAVLALKSLDTGAGRFNRTRRILFDFAHEDARADAAAHLDAGRYDRAFGVTRKHAVEWSATATVLGPTELKKLDEFRERYAFFAALAASATPSPEALEVAPPPRLKP